MHIVNVHKRVFDSSKNKIVDLLNTLSSDDDEVWPKEKWPRMKLDNGLTPGSKGGHGPISYFVESHDPGKQIVFRFTNPKGFEGVHKFDIEALGTDKTECVHTIDMEIKGIAVIKWFSVIKWLHDALIEDGLDKMHYKITNETKTTKWNLWVKMLRRFLR